ncbi:MAG: hypothetical protein WDN69_30600 [Aliidongia sp.]
MKAGFQAKMSTMSRHFDSETNHLYFLFISTREAYPCAEEKTLATVYALKKIQAWLTKNSSYWNRALWPASPRIDVLVRLRC